MVRRASTAARTLPGRLQQTERGVTQNARAQGRGSTALRDSSGNLIQMRGDAPYPLLSPQGIDAAVAFDGTGTVKMVSPDTQEDRDLTVRGMAASGPSSVQGHLGVVGQIEADTVGTKVLGVGTVNGARYTAGPVNIDGAGILTPGIGVGGRCDVGRLTCGPVNIDGGGIASPGIAVGGVGYFGRAQVGQSEVPVNGRITGREMTLEGNCLVKGNLYVNGAINPPSERYLKDDLGEIGDALASIREWVAARYRWLDPGQRDDRAHVGLYVNELAETDPDLVVSRGEVDEVPTVDPDRARTASEGRTYEDRGVLAYVVRGVQQVDERLARIEAHLGMT